MLTGENILKMLRLVIVLTAVYILSQTSSILMPLIIAIVITFLLNPFVEKLQRVNIWPFRKGLPRPLTVAIVMATFFILMFLFIMLAFAPLLKEMVNFVSALPIAMVKVKDIFLDWFDKIQAIELPPKVNESLEKLSSEITTISLSLLWRFVYGTIFFISNAIEVVIAPLLAYYFLIDGKNMVRKLCFILPSELRNRAYEVFLDMGQVVNDYINGQVIICVIMGIAVTVGTYFLGIEYFVVLGIIAALLETIPYIGPIAGAMPGIFFAFVISPDLAIKTMIFYLFIHQLEANIVVPQVMGKKIAVHPVIIMFSMLIGGKLFGIIGMMMALPVTALLRVILKALWFDNDIQEEVFKLGDVNNEKN